MTMTSSFWGTLLPWRYLMGPSMWCWKSPPATMSQAPELSIRTESSGSPCLPSLIRPQNRWNGKKSWLLSAVLLGFRAVPRLLLDLLPRDVVPGNDALLGKFLD